VRICEHIQAARALRPVLAAIFLLAAGLAAQKSPGLLPEHKLWLEDVGPIITRVERDVFMKLATPQERETFIRFFWRSRDPSPDTTENEFRKEYYERIRFADTYFGIGSHKRGSQTDRGFYYVLLGPPRERHQFTTQSQIWPLELWFYKGEEAFGLPAYFYLIFYQPQGIGDFRLYAPGPEGPESLVIPSLYGSTADRSGAYKTLKQINGELAGASLSYLPGESPLGAGSFSSDTIVASVRRLPEKKFADGYARNYLAFKDHVETEYLDRYFDSAHQLKLFRDGGQPFLHWTIEPERMSFGTQGSSIYASFELVLRLEDDRGTALFERTEEIPLRLTPDQYKANERRRFAFQDLLPVIPGPVRAFFLLKNKTARDFTSFEARLTVPGEGRPGLSAPLLYHARTAVPEARRNNTKAFVFDGYEYLVGARNEFLPAETLGVFAQAWDLDGAGGARPSFVVDLVSLDEGRSAGVFPLSAAEAPRSGGTVAVTGEVPLAGIKPGYYRAEVSALDADGRKIFTEKENFILLGQPAPVAPWVYARLHGPFPGPDHLKVLGAQHFLAGDHGRAREALERSLRTRDDPDTRLMLAKSLFGLGLLSESLAQAVPLYERVPDRETAKVIALAYAGLKEWESALEYLEKIMAEATEVPVLNLAAECHLALGRPEKALPLLQRSLALAPDQPAVKELEEKARKRRDI
jgi:GWxTD domain-containing protein